MKDYIKGFDGLRAISITFVLFTHLGLYAYLPATDFFSQRFIKLINGTIGVNIFFAISGFLITTILLKEKKAKGSINYTNFFARRFLRLLPTLLLFYIIITVLMYLGKIDKSYAGLGISLFYLYNFVPNKFYTGELGHTWSLAVEEQFYLFWPFIINIMNRYKPLLAAGAILLLCILSVFIIPGLTIPYNGKKFALGYLFNTSRWFLPAAASIMMGAGIAVLNFYEDPKIIRFFSSSLCFILSLLLFVAPLYLPYFLFDYIYIIQALGISLLLIWMLHHQNSALTNFLELKPMVFVGRISYGIYVWQGLFLRTSPGGKLLVQQFPLNIILVFAIATVSYYTIEKYALSLKHRFK